MENSLNKIIKKLIKQDLNNGLKQIEISKKIGVTQPAIYRYLETDTEPTVATLKKFSKAYNIPIEVLSGEIIKEYSNDYLSIRQQQLADIESQLDDEDFKDMIKYGKYLIEKKKSNKAKKTSTNKKIALLFNNLTDINIKLEHVSGLPERLITKEREWLKRRKANISLEIKEITGLPLNEAFENYIKKPSAA